MSNNRSAFSLLTSLFFMWGFITVMNDVLINTFRNIFTLSPFQVSLVQSAFFGAFFVISLIYFIISSSRGKDPINQIGYKKGMSIALAVCGVGCILFYPAAELESYAAFLTALFILASGVALLQICANPYATILGNPETASSRLNLAQGFNSLGTTLGPIVGTLFIYRIFSDGVLTVQAVSNTYLIYGSAFLLLAMFVLASKMPPFKNDETIEPGLGVFKYRHLTLGVLAIFFYVGSEVAIGSWLVTFIKSPEIGNMEEAKASYYLSYFWGGLMIGRLMAGTAFNAELPAGKKYIRMILLATGAFLLIYFVTSIDLKNGEWEFNLNPFNTIALYLVFIALSFSAFIVSFNRPGRALVVFMSINAVLITLSILLKGYWAMWCILGTGLFFSVGWSNIFSLAIKDLKKYTSQGSALLVMAIVGGAVLPSVQSLMIDEARPESVQYSFIIPLIGMIYLIFYGAVGHKIKK